MKKLYILIALTSLFFVQSCDKFLDLKPENIQVVSTIEDYRDILASYMRLLKTVDGSQKPVLGGYFFIPRSTWPQHLLIVPGNSPLIKTPVLIMMPLWENINKAQ